MPATESAFFNGPNSSKSMNESVRVDDNGHMLFLKASGVGFGRGHGEEQLSIQGAAELFWAMLIEPLQRWRKARPTLGGYKSEWSS